MTHAVRTLFIAAVLVLAVTGSTLAADVQVGINIGVPPPVLVAPPPFVVVPSTPAVRYAPEAPYDVFFYGGQYYAWQNGWFVSARIGDPWVSIAASSVPRPILVVPAQYYRVPPRHFYRVPPGHVKHEYHHADYGHGEHGHGGHGDHGDHGTHGDHGKHKGK